MSEHGTVRKLAARGAEKLEMIGHRLELLFEEQRELHDRHRREQLASREDRKEALRNALPEAHELPREELEALSQDDAQALCIDWPLLQRSKRAQVSIKRLEEQLEQRKAVVNAQAQLHRRLTKYALDSDAMTYA